MSMHGIVTKMTPSSTSRKWQGRFQRESRRRPKIERRHQFKAPPARKKCDGQARRRKGPPVIALRNLPIRRKLMLVMMLATSVALLLSGSEGDWSIKKGAVWWFSNRMREGETQTVLRASIAPDLL